MFNINGKAQGDSNVLVENSSSELILLFYYGNFQMYAKVKKIV